MSYIIKLDVKFDLVDNKNKIIIVDKTTDDSGNPITYKAGLKINTPVGVVYNNVDYLTSPDFTQSIKTREFNIPVDKDGKPIQGEYKVRYEVKDLVSGEVIIKGAKFEFIYHSPEPALNTNVDILAPLLASVDTTSYRQLDVDPVFNRELAIFFPPTTGKPEITSTSDIVITNEFFHTGLTPLQHQVKLKAYLEYNFPVIAGIHLSFFVLDYISLVEPINVVNPFYENDMYQTLSNMYRQWKSYQGKRF